MITLYGIPNCDTVKKAQKWLTENNLDYYFHDFKKQGLDQNILEHWVAELGWQTLLNKRSLTWRKLTDTAKADLDQQKAIQIMLENTSIIKRPVVDNDGVLASGFKDEQFRCLFNL